MKKKKNISFPDAKKIFRIIQFSLFFILLLFIPASGNVLTSKTVSLTIDPTPQVTLTPAPPRPVNVTKAGAPIISAESVVIKDLTSGDIILAKDEKKLLFPASVTKLMTAIVAFEKYNLDDILTVKTVVDSGRVMNLVEGEKLSVESLLYGTLVHSANDAAYVLAENYPGGVEAFVRDMNLKVKSLGLEDTNFTNPVGFDDPRHYTTASDLVTLSVYALQNKLIDKIVSTKSITVSDTSYTYFHELHNVNQLLGKVAGIAGLKTGFTEAAGEILISVVKKNGQNVLFVVLKSKDRFGETVKLIDWVFNNFQWH